jgi:hypothetical protein
MEKFVSEILEKYKKYKILLKRDQKIEKIVENFIKEKNLIIYGGMAIDVLIKNKTNGEFFYYDEFELPDYDVFSLNNVNDAIELSNILNKSYNKIAIKTGIKGKTKKIFVNLDPSAIIDITSVTANFINKLNTVNIRGITYAGPQYLKIDQYQNLSENVFIDYFRIKKAYKKILLLERFFPLKKVDIPKQISIKKKIPIRFRKGEIIFGGDYALKNYYNDIIIDTIVLFSNQLYNKYIPAEGIIIDNIIIMPIKGVTFYNLNEKNEKISTKLHLLYTYYTLRFYYNTNIHNWKIQKLLSNIDWKKKSLMFSPKYPMIEKYIEKTKTMYFE